MMEVLPLLPDLTIKYEKCHGYKINEHLNFASGLIIPLNGFRRILLSDDVISGIGKLLLYPIEITNDDGTPPPHKRLQCKHLQYYWY
jgi:hypothetical protein